MRPARLYGAKSEADDKTLTSAFGSYTHGLSMLLSSLTLRLPAYGLEGSSTGGACQAAGRQARNSTVCGQAN